MTAPPPVLDLDDAASLQAADSLGALRSAALAGAQVRATATAVDEGALARLQDLRPRSIVFVTGSGRAARAAALLIGAVGEQAGLPLLQVTAAPPWVGPLDVVVVAGDDSGDPRLAESVARATRRGAEVVVAAPEAGPLRTVAAGRTALLPPRVRVLDQHTMIRFVAVGIAVLAAVDGTRSAAVLPELAQLADALDGEALRDHPRNEVFHNPAKALAARMQGRRVVFAGDGAACAELARHAVELLLRTTGTVAAAADLGDAVAAVPRLRATAAPADYDPFFHDEQLDGPAPASPVRVLVLSTEPDERKIAIFDDADLIAVDGERGRTLADLSVLTVRLEMAAAYLQLLGGMS